MGTRGVADGILNVADTIAFPARVPFNLINGWAGGDPNYFKPLAGTVPDALGLPQPETPFENLAYQANSGLTSMLATYGLGSFMGLGTTTAATPTTPQVVGKALTANPGAQAVSATASGVALGAAQNAGAGPVGQFAAATLAGMATPGGGAKRGPRIIGQSPKEFAGAIRNRPLEARAAYRERFGSILDVDNARELCGDYGASRNGRIINTSAVHKAAGDLINGIYNDILKEAPTPGQRNTITFTAGAGGAGKSTAIESNLPLQRHIKTSQTVLDTTFSSPGSLKKVDQALKAGKDVDIFYVAREPLEAIVSTFRRAERDGRYVPLKTLVEGHIAARENIREAARHYTGDARVKIFILDNTQSGQQRLSTPGLLDKLSYGNLLQRAQYALEMEHKNGRISEELYRRILDHVHSK